MINKVGRLFLSPTMRDIFGQPDNKIHPRKIMDGKKIFIVNLAKGAIGDDAARIIGALLIAQFFSASLTRRDIPEGERADFSLVVDEFPSFSTTVSVGTDHDTSSFAVATIRRWWQSMGQALYPSAKELTITADGAGSNGSRVRLWKLELQHLADELALPIRVLHLPPGTSKWNKIEHRLFSYISMNWRGKAAFPCPDSARQKATS